ncbi:alcohol dehydrogenase catalytic domain-containing protein [Candidatus Aerophobetes bacterium]|nr:alcohol dehydrogenase catalytic domain-containing protein [Candidatus Aerophobetes bacterium]
MKAVLLEAPFKVKIKEIERPSPKENEVLIKVKATCVCGSDIHAYRGTHPFRLPPIVPGHEMAGEVVETGKNVKDIKPGDPVTVEPWSYCEKCEFCREGKFNLCLNKKGMGTKDWQGSFAEYVVAPEKSVYKLPSNVSFEEGALVEPLAVCVHVVRKADITLGDKVVILGAGPIGLGILMCCSEAGANKVVITDIEEFNLRFASKIGGISVNAGKDCLEKVVEEATRGKGADTVVIAAGEESLVNQASKIIKKAGKVIIPALFEKPAELDMFEIVYGEKTLVGSWAYVSRDFHLAIELLASKKIRAKDLITHRFRIEDAEEAFQIVDKRKEKVIKAVFVF